MIEQLSSQKPHNSLYGCNSCGHLGLERKFMRLIITELRRSCQFWGVVTLIASFLTEGISIFIKLLGLLPSWAIRGGNLGTLPDIEEGWVGLGKNCTVVTFLVNSTDRSKDLTVE